MAFPYPVNGTVTRPTGQGCLNCVRNEYCPAYYWIVRYDGPVDDHNGLSCTSYSVSPADVNYPITPADVTENEYESLVAEILTEKNRCGIVEPITANRHELPF